MDVFVWPCCADSMLSASYVQCIWLIGYVLGGSESKFEGRGSRVVGLWWTTEDRIYTAYHGRAFDVELVGRIVELALVVLVRAEVSSHRD